MLVGRQDPEHIRLPLSQIEDGITRRPHGCLSVDTLPAATPNHRLEGKGGPGEGREISKHAEETGPTTANKTTPATPGHTME